MILQTIDLHGVTFYDACRMISLMILLYNIFVCWLKSGRIIFQVWITNLYEIVDLDIGLRSDGLIKLWITCIICLIFHYLSALHIVHRGVPLRLQSLHLHRIQLVRCQMLIHLRRLQVLRAILCHFLLRMWHNSRLLHLGTSFFESFWCITCFHWIRVWIW